MRLLVTRPEPAATRTAAALRKRGHEVVLSPVLRFEDIAAAIPAGPWDAILMTSAQAARAVASHPQLPEITGIEVVAVGHGTARAALAAGFARVTPAAGDVTELGRLMVARYSRARLLYLAGVDRAGDLADDLGARRLDVHTVEIYRAHECEMLSADAEAALAKRRIEAVLHYSPRSAAAFLALVSRADLVPQAFDATHYCLSVKVAAPLAQAGVPSFRVASSPNEADLLDLLER